MSGCKPPGSSFVYSPDPGGLQPDIDHDVLYREGLTANGEVTYPPRLVSLDLKGSLGLLPQYGDLYYNPRQENLPDENWCQGETVVWKEESRKKNEFLRDLAKQENNAPDSDKDVDIGEKDEVNKPVKLYNLDGEVKFWSDYLLARFHHKTNIVVDAYKHNNTLDPFDTYGQGTKLWTDTVRFFAEECDNMAGVNIVTDCVDGWGGTASSP